MSDMIDVLVEDYGDEPFPCTFIHRHDRQRVCAFDKKRAVEWLLNKVTGGSAMVAALPDRLLFEELLIAMGNHGYEFLVEGGHTFQLS